MSRELMKGGQYNDIHLLMQNTKLGLFHNGGENILNNIVKCSMFPTMGATKKVGLC
jgi:hypothetical protein